MMKRFFALFCSISLMLFSCAVLVSASDIFEPAGDVEITWLAKEQAQQIEFDGNLDEWKNFDVPFKTLDQTNLVTWLVDDESNRFDEPDAIGHAFALNTYFAADEDYLYVAFHIKDDTFTYGNDGGNYNGDAIMIGVDWNRHMEGALLSNVDYQNNKNITYSFSCTEDGAPLTVRVQEGFRDRDITEADTAQRDVPDMKGAACATTDGWCAEIALSWGLLYSDYEYKTWESPVDMFSEGYPMVLGMTMSYLNREETNGPILWAAGTFDNDTTYPNWEPTNNGLYAQLEWAEGRRINCSGMGTYHTHTFSEWSIVQEPSCVEAGVKSRACLNCYYIQTESIPKTEHTFGEWVSTAEPTCTTPGSRTRVCTACGLCERLEFDPAGHNYTEEIGIQPTCTEEGLIHYTCTVCGAEKSEAIPALGHDFGEWVVWTEATRYREGTRVRVCQRCQKADSEKIPRLSGGMGSGCNMGCRSSFGTASILLLTTLGATFMMLKKKDD